MPPNPPINDVVRVIIPFLMAGSFCGQTHVDFHLDGGFTWSQPLADDVVGVIGTALLGNNVDDALSTDITVPEWIVYDLNNPNHDPLFVESTFHGGEAGDPLPCNVSALVSIRTGFSGRSNRGRAYWPGYTEASSDGNTFNITSQTNLAGAYTDMQVDIDNYQAGSAICVVSFLHATSRDAVAFNVESKWATQRPRLERFR